MRARRRIDIAIAPPNRTVEVVGVIEYPEDLRTITGIAPVMLYDCSGIYFLCRAGRVVYVGQSTHIMSRVASHCAEGSKSFDSVFYVEVPESQLDLRETYYILEFAPEYNQTHSLDAELELLMDRVDKGKLPSIIRAALFSPNKKKLIKLLRDYLDSGGATKKPKLEVNK